VKNALSPGVDASRFERIAHHTLGNVRWGVTWGLRLALLFSAWVAFLMLANRSLILRVSGVHPVNGLQVIGIYVGGGIGGGIVVGLLRPLSRWALGAALLGLLAALPFAVGLAFLGSNFSRPDFDDVLPALITAAVLGPSTALWLWGRYRQGR
jgi:hypothetical protein